MPSLNWIFGLKQKIPGFLKKMKGQKIPGFFHYSLTGDLYSEHVRWGLGNTVFAVKIYYMLGLLNNLTDEEKKEIGNFIKSFQRRNGNFYDPLVKKLTFWKDKLSALKNLDFNNFLHKQTIKAETRQAISALSLLQEKPNIPYTDFPKTKKEIDEYLSKLNWEKPWGAGSHFSHLIFFLKNGDLVDKENLIDYAINWINKLQHPENGVWYIGNPGLQQKINGAMKIITGLKVAEKVNFKCPEKLIDLCLLTKNDRHACDNFNIVYVLKYANELTRFSYKYKEIKEFALQRLAIYKQYYYSEIGGFSFLPKKANIYYYGAKITKGLNEPDIHGTVMFLWGISIISQILGFNEKIKLIEVVP